MSSIRFASDSYIRRFFKAGATYAGNLLAALYICTSSPVFAEEVLYCVDTAVVGFQWDQKGQASITKFVPSRYTVKIIRPPGDLLVQRLSRPPTPGMAFAFFIEKRIVTGEGLRSPIEMECKSTIGADVICGDDLGMLPWAFGSDNRYTHAFFPGPPTDGRNDPNIWIAYGTCTKF
jgi:hypothetical protein